MTVRQLINKLQTIVEREPNKRDVEVYVYIGDVDQLLDDGESPQPITYVDGDISDRVDLNVAC